MASSSRTPNKAARSPESFDSLFHRNAAAEVLQSYEKLSWHSFQRCESLAQTRLHFQNIVAGFTDADEAALVDWKEDRTPRPKPGEEERSGKKGRERVSAGSAGGGDEEVVAGSSAQKKAKSREKSESSNGGGGSTKKKRKSVGQ